MSSVTIVGYSGRMSQNLRQVLEKENTEFKVFSDKAPETLKVSDFKESLGVIDFSTPETAPLVAAKAAEAKVPVVCGTTGWKSDNQAQEIFKELSKVAPVVIDSNFSFGIEILCQVSELLSKALGSREKLFITDLHHKNKKDSPSGTSLKIEKRIKESNPETTTEHQVYRIGEVAGEHRVSVAWENEYLEFTHRAFSKEAFSKGAIRALEWAKKQKPGIYSMKDVIR